MVVARQATPDAGNTSYTRGTNAPGVFYYYKDAKGRWQPLPERGLRKGTTYDILVLHDKTGTPQVGQDNLAQFKYKWGSADFQQNFRTRSGKEVITVRLDSTKSGGLPIVRSTSAIRPYVAPAPAGTFTTTTRNLLATAGLDQGGTYRVRFGNDPTWYPINPASLDKPIYVAKNIDVTIAEPAGRSGTFWTLNYRNGKCVGYSSGGWEAAG